ncbi:hypothetical protein TNCV_1251271 [Trichonephila clavipes]|nr:hypothetical protein TNCV_1251271 [Trichonephila clavipes]
MKTFDQTLYKLPPPTPIHIPYVPEPVQIPLVSEPPVQIPYVPEPVQIPLVSEPPVQIPLVSEPPVQIPDVPEPVHIPVSQVPQPPVQIPVSQVPQSPVQIPFQPADSRCRTCADSSVTSPTVTATCADVPDVSLRPPVQIPVSQVPQSPVQIPVSQVPQPPVQIPHVPEPPVQIPPEPPFQILHVPETTQIPQPVQIPPELNPFEPTDAIDQFMSFVFEPPDQELQLLHTVPSNFDGDLISFLDEFERELAPMDLIMPILDPCVKKSIEFKAIQPMDLSVNSCL